MIVDHICLYAHTGNWLRWTVGRLAAPLFFILAGHLARRLSWRHAWLILGAGALVPHTIHDLVLPAIGIGCVVVVLARRLGVLVPATFVTLVAATALPLTGTYFTPLTTCTCLLGAQLSRQHLLRAGQRLPRWLRWLGRWPLTTYLAHLWLLEGLFA